MDKASSRRASSDSSITSSPSWRVPFAEGCCFLLAAHGEGLAASIWLWVQILAWVFASAVACYSALSWTSNWGVYHSNLFQMFGEMKTVGFMLADLMAIFVLLRSRRAREHSWAAHLKSVTGCAQAREARRRSREAVAVPGVGRLEHRARLLVSMGVILAVTLVLYWILFLYDIRERFNDRPVYTWATAATSVCIVLTSPGLVCAVFPALAGREEAEAAFQGLLEKVQLAKTQQCDWNSILLQYAEVDGIVTTLSQELSPIVQAWLWTMGVSAVSHGTSLWIWIDKLCCAPVHAVYLTHGLALLYALIFLRVFFMFSGMGRLHQELIELTHSSLAKCPASELDAFMRALTYFERHHVCWTVELWPGSTVEISQLRGKLLSIGLLTNIVAKGLPRLLKSWSAAGLITPENADLILTPLRGLRHDGRPFLLPGAGRVAPMAPGPTPPRCSSGVLAHRTGPTAPAAEVPTPTVAENCARAMSVGAAAAAAIATSVGSGAARRAARPMPEERQRKQRRQRAGD